MCGVCACIGIYVYALCVHNCICCICVHVCCLYVCLNAPMYVVYTHL